MSFLDYARQIAGAGSDASGDSGGVDAPASPAISNDVRQIIVDAALRHDVDPKVAIALAQTESSLKPNAVGPATKYGNGRGLYQIVDGFQKDYGVDPTTVMDPHANADGALAKFRANLDALGGDYPQAIAAHQAGLDAVQRAGGVPNTSDGLSTTPNYVAKVLALAGGQSAAAQTPAKAPANFLDYARSIAGSSGETAAPPTSETLGASAVRGAKVSAQQLAQMGTALVAMGGEAIGSTGLRNWGVDKTAAIGDDIAKEAQPSDNFTDAVKPDGHLANWMSYTVANTLGQFVPSILSGGVGAYAAKTAARSGVEAIFAASMSRALTDELAGGASLAAAKSAATDVAVKATQDAMMKGAGAANIGYSIGQEAGQIFPTEVDQAKKEGRDINLGRAAALSVPAGLVEAIPENALGASLIHGVSTKGNLWQRVAANALQRGGVGAAQEGTQTYLERIGAGQSLNDDDAHNDVINSMAAGALGEAVPGGFAGIRRATEVRASAPVVPKTVATPDDATPAQTASQAATPTEAATLPITPIISPDVVIAQRAASSADDDPVGASDLEATLSRMHADAHAELQSIRSFRPAITGESMPAAAVPSSAQTSIVATPDVAEPNVAAALANASDTPPLSGAPATVDTALASLKNAPSSAEVAAAAHEAATSPTNDLPQPTDAQKEAGNYKKGHVSIDGLDITIENPQGSVRSGPRPDGSTWSHTMSDHYGYIKRTIGADAEQVDTYIGPKPDAPTVYVVDQVHQDGKGFDEHKAMIGYPDEQSARAAYASNFDPGWKVGPVTAMSMPDFKAWVRGSENTTPAHPDFEAIHAATRSDTSAASGESADAGTGREAAGLPEDRAVNAGDVSRPDRDAQPVASGPALPRADQPGAATPAALKPEQWGAPMLRKGSATKLQAQRDAQRADYFTPGNIISNHPSSSRYAGPDRVVSYTPATKNAAMSVKVERVERDGDGWKAVGPVRQHSTVPNPRATIVERAAPTQPPQAYAPATDADRNVRLAAADKANGEAAIAELHRAQAMDGTLIVRDGAVFRRVLSDRLGGTAPKGVTAAFDFPSINKMVWEKREADADAPYAKTLIDRARAEGKAVEGIAKNDEHMPSREAASDTAPVATPEASTKEGNAEKREPGKLETAPTEASPPREAQEPSDQPLVKEVEREQNSLEQRRSQYDPRQLDLFAPQKGDYDESAKPSRVAGTAADDAVRRSGDEVRVRALGIPEEIEHVGAAALVGRRVDSPHDVASLAQVYRDPRFETLRYFFTKGNEIVGATGVSSRLPGQTPLFPHGLLGPQGLAWLRSLIDTHDADGLYLLHNHPSGDPTPSHADSMATRFVAQSFPEFKGHVVINSNRYAVIDGGGDPSIFDKHFGEDRLLTATVDSGYLGTHVRQIEDVASIGKAFQRPGWVTAIGQGNSGVRIIADIPVRAMSDAATQRKMIHDLAVRGGSPMIFLAGETADLKAVGADMLHHEGFIRDAVSELGKSIVALRHDAADRESFGGRAGEVVKESSADYADGQSLVERAREATTRVTTGALADNWTPIAKRAHDLVFDAFSKSTTFSPWARTIGTQMGKARTNAEFKPVFERAQKFLDDITKAALRSEGLAPTILPKVGGLGDVPTALKQAIGRAGMSKADNEWLGRALADGTLAGKDEGDGPSPLNGKVFTDDELRERGATDTQVTVYHEARASIDQALEDSGRATMISMLRASGVDQETLDHLDLGAPKMDDILDWARGHIDDRMEQMRADAEQQFTDAKAEADTRMQAELDKTSMPSAKLAIKERYAEEEAPLREKAFAPVEAANQLSRNLRDVLDKGRALQQAGYAPLSRFGRYFLTAFDGDNVTFFRRYDSPAELLRERRAMTTENPEWEFANGEMSKEEHKQFQGVDPSVMALFAKEAGLHDEAFQKWYELATAERSAMKRLLHRQGAEGYTLDARRALASFLTSNSRFVSSATNVAALRDIVSGVSDGGVKDEAIKLQDYVTNPVEEAAALRGFMFSHFLGASLASGVVNLTQPVLMTYPYLAGYGPAKAAVAMKEGIAAAVSSMRDRVIKNPSLAAAMDKAKAEGVVDPSEIHALMAASRGAYKSPAMQAFQTVWGANFAVTEAFNRKTTFAAAYLLAERAGEQDPYAVAKKAVYDTQGLYSRANRPNWARGAVGATLFTFKQFSIAYVEFLQQLVREGKMPKTQLSIALGLMLAAAGTQGLPGADDLDDIIDALGQALGFDTNIRGSKRRMLESVLGKTGAQIAQYGLSTQFGVDLQGRLGMGNLVPGTGALIASNPNKGKDIAEWAGPLGALITNTASAMQDLLGGHFGAAIGDMSSTAGRNAAQGLTMLTTGEARDDKGRTIKDVTPVEAISKMAGFTPTRVANESRAIGDIKRDENIVNYEANKIREQWATGIARGDQDAIAEARQKLKDWNADNPEMAIKIKPQDVMRRANDMKKTRADRTARAVPSSMRSDARVELTD